MMMKKIHLIFICMRRANDVIRFVVQVQVDGVVVRTVENLDTVTSYGMESVLSYDGRAFRGFLSVEGFRMMTDASIPGLEVQNDAFGWGARLNLSYRLDNLGLPGAMVQAMARYRAPMRTEQGRTSVRIGAVELPVARRHTRELRDVLVRRARGTS
jgi:hypothetical protein